MNCSSLNQLVDVFHKTTDPSDSKGVRHDLHGMLLLIFLGQLAQLPYIAWTRRWAKKYWHILRAPLGEVFATLTNFALSILRLLQHPGDSLIETAENLRYSPQKNPPDCRN